MDTDPVRAHDAPAVSAALPPGSRLGRYEIERQLGQGGMGCVFLAYDPTLRRKVAAALEDVAGAAMSRFVAGRWGFLPAAPASAGSR